MRQAQDNWWGTVLCQMELEWLLTKATDGYLMVFSALTQFHYII